MSDETRWDAAARRRELRNALIVLGRDLAATALAAHDPAQKREDAIAAARLFEVTGGDDLPPEAPR